MKLKNLNDPLKDLDDEVMTKRPSAEDVGSLISRFGVQAEKMGPIFDLIASSVEDARAKRVPWTGVEIIKTALQFMDNETSFEKRADRMALAFRIMANPDEAEFEKADIAELKTLIAKTFPAPIIAHRMNDIFKASLEEAKKPKSPDAA